MQLFTLNICLDRRLVALSKAKKTFRTTYLCGEILCGTRGSHHEGTNGLPQKQVEACRYHRMDREDRREESVSMEVVD